VQSITRLVPEFRLALRRTLREPGFTAASVVTVAVGIGIAASVFALVEGVLLRPLPYPESERLVSIRHLAPAIDLVNDRVSAGVFLHYRDGNRAFDAIGGYEPTFHTFTDGDSPDRIRTAVVTPELFSVLEATPLLGRLPSAEDWDVRAGEDGATTGVLLGHELWMRRYDGDPGILGRTIEVSGRQFLVVTGIAREGFSFPDVATEAWLAYPQERLSWSARAEVREGMHLNAVARLRDGVTREAAEADLNRLVGLLPERFPDVTAADVRDFGLRATLVPFKDEIVGDVRLTLLLVLASGAFLLLVAWANVATLLLLRTHARRVEIGITRALGASEGSIATRLLAESLVLTGSGGLLGLAIASIAIRARVGFTPRHVPRLDEVGLSGTVVALVAVLAIASGIVMAAICLASTRERVAGTSLSGLRSRSTTQNREGQTGRRILVAAQVALSLTLLVGSGLMARTFLRLQQVDLGFRTDGGVAFFLPVTHLSMRADHEEYAALHARVMERLGAVPGIEAVEAASSYVFPLSLPENSSEPATVAPVGAKTDDRDPWPRARYGYATPGYFETMGIPLVAGRSFRNDDSTPGAAGVILSQSLARALFGDVDPLGRHVEFPEFRSFWTSHVVVGVAGDVPGSSLRDGGARVLYLPHVFPLAAGVTSRTLHPFMPHSEIYVVRTDRDVAALVPDLRRAIFEVDPQLAMLDTAPLDELVTAATAQERFTLRLLLVSSAAALFLALVGIYSVLAYSVRRRTAEIGVRMALGASPARVTRLVVKQGALLCGAGVAAGIVGALAVTRSIGALLFGVSPTDPLTFAAMTLLLLVGALAASYIPARRASRIDPAVALRAE
jgi:predicted permease